MNASISGNYTLRSRSPMDSVVYLYYPSFDQMWPSLNLIITGDLTGVNPPHRIRYFFDANIVYYLVVTPFSSGSVGLFDLAIIGQGAVNITEIPSKDEKRTF